MYSSVQILNFIYKRSSIFLTLLSLWAGFWFSRVLTSNAALPTFAEAIFDYLLNFATPVPYFLFVVGVEVWGFIREVGLEQENIEIRERAERAAALDASLRIEKQGHAESKSSYSDTLKAALRLMLCTGATRFDHRCRISIYRRQANTDDVLRQIFRFSDNQAFKVGGRFRIPMHEGVVGAAWNNHGVKHVAIDISPDIEEFSEKMADEIRDEGCVVPSCDLSMPSKEFYAKGLDDHETGHRVGVVVYESVETGVFDVDQIDAILNAQSLDLARFVKHLGRLDQEFAPNVRET